MSDVDKVIAERGARGDRGDFSDCAAWTQSMKFLLHGGNCWDDLPATHKEALEMMALKMGRILTGGWQAPDNWLDLSGYSKMVYDRLPVAHASTEEPAAQATRPIRQDEEQRGHVISKGYSTIKVKPITWGQGTVFNIERCDDTFIIDNGRIYILDLR